MSKQPVVIAGPSGGSRPHFVYENPIDVREQWAPWSRPWVSVGTADPVHLGYGSGSAPYSQASSVNAVTLYIALNNRFDLTNTPAAGGFRLAEFLLDYERTNAGDTVLFELRRRSRSTGNVGVVASYDETSEFTTTGSRDTFSTSVSHDLDLENYDYFLALSYKPASAAADVKIYSLDLAFAMEGVQP